MAESRKVVRKIDNPSLADFDEQWWPITLLLFISAGALAGYVYTSPGSDFTTDVWYRNAWNQIYSIGALAVLLVVGLAFLRGSANRRLQLGVFLSLVFHLTLIYGSRQYYLTYIEPATPANADSPDDGGFKVVIPDYIPPEQEGEASPEITRPVEAQPAQEKQVEITPKPPELIKAEKQAVAQPETKREPQPKPLEMAKAELTEPRKIEPLPKLKLTRNPVAEPLPTENAPQPLFNRPTQAKPTEPSLADAERREMESQTAERPELREPRPQTRTPSPATRAEPTRYEVENQLALNDIKASRDRKLNEATLPVIEAAPRAEPASAATVTSELPRDAATVSTAAANAPAVPAPSPTLSPQMSPALSRQSGATSAVMLSRAESPQPSDFASLQPTQSIAKQSNYGALTDGFESIPVETTAPPTAAPATISGGGSQASLAGAAQRGERGAPAVLSAEGLPSPAEIGVGSGAASGSPFVGPRRAETAGDGQPGEMAALMPTSRPGRGRTTGTVTLGVEQVPMIGTSGVAGPTTQPGNSVSGEAGDARATTVGIGRGVGERMGNQLGPATLIAPSGGGLPGGIGTGAAAGPSTGAGSAVVGAAGAGGGPASGATLGMSGTLAGGRPAAAAGASAAISRRDSEELAGAAGGAMNGFDGKSRPRMKKSDGQRDRHGNLLGSANDLIVDGQMIGEKIVIIAFFNDEEIEGTPLISALGAKGYVVERLTAALPPIEEFARKLDGARQLWLISSDVNRLPAQYLTELVDRWRTGRLALCLMADNAPFTAEATAVLNIIAPGTTITGDYLGERKLQARENGGVGFDPAQPLFHNVETLFEGTTISGINSRYLTTVCYASNGRPLIGIYQQQGSSRLIVHCGFTSLYERFWDDAGVSRFAVNVAGWLSEVDQKRPTVRIVPTPSR